MAEYRLSQRAKAQLLAIYKHTVGAFGPYQADAYYSGLAHTFDLLADFPLMGPNAETLAPGLRRFRFQSHNIFYTAEDGKIFIRQILDTRMQARPDLFR